MASKDIIGTSPRAQESNSTTFRPPPQDRFLLVSEIFHHHYLNSPNHPIFKYEDSPGIVKTIYWSDWYLAIHRAGRYVRKIFGFSEEPNERPVIAMLANTDLITYLTTEMGIVRAEGVFFSIYPGNTLAALTNLLVKGGAKYLLITEDWKDLAATVVANMPVDRQVRVAYMPSFYEHLFPENEDNFEFLPPAKYRNIHDPIAILHSTGTTGLPKPVTYSHINFQIYGRTPSYGERDLTGMVISAHGLAVYGVTAAQQAVMACGCGLVLSVFKPASPPTVASADSLYDGALVTNSDFIYCIPPIFLQAWSKDLGRVKYLKTIQGILTGGSPLEKLVGDSLSAEGVPIYHMFGCTEASCLTVMFPREPQRHWDYFRFSTNVKTHFVPNGCGAYELILLDMGPDFLIPAVINTKIGNVNGYATRDLFVPHPTIPGYWKSYGRVDDQILHSTAQITNPVPLESILNVDSHIQGAVIFGRGKLNTGVVIDPHLPYKFDPQDEDKLNDFRDKIWPTVKKVNEVAPHHSRISREMIIVSSPAKPFAYTAKSTASRPMVTTNYEPEIEALYVSVAKTVEA